MVRWTEAFPFPVAPFPFSPKLDSSGFHVLLSAHRCRVPVAVVWWRALSLFIEMQVLAFQHYPPLQLLLACVRLRARSTCW